MRGPSLLMSLCAALTATVVSTAAAAYNTPQQAARQMAPMVTAYNSCLAPTLIHQPGQPGPACVPAQSSANHPASIYTFGQQGSRDAGSATVSIRRGSGDLKISAVSRAVWKNGSLYSGNDLVGAATMRITDNGCGAAFNMDCTQVDFPLPLFMTCSDGDCRMDAPSFNGIVPEFAHSGDGANIEIGQISIRDEQHDTVATEGLVVRNSAASAGFNAPKRGLAKLTRDMVTAYNECTAPSLTHRPNLANPACVPAQSSANDATSIYTFGPSGDAVATLSPGKTDLKVMFKGSGIYRNGTSYSGDGLAMTATVRTTDDGCGLSPAVVACTRTDVPIPVPVTCVNGSCTSGALTLNGILPGAIRSGATSNIEVRQIAINDEDGDTFARPGILVR